MAINLLYEEKQDAECVSQALSDEVRNSPSAVAEDRQFAVSVQNERVVQLAKADFDSQEENMLQVMDRYRTYYMEETSDLSYVDDGDEADLMMAMGTFLKQIDT